MHTSGCLLCHPLAAICMHDNDCHPSTSLSTSSIAASLQCRVHKARSHILRDCTAALQSRKGGPHCSATRMVCLCLGLAFSVLFLIAPLLPSCSFDYHSENLQKTLLDVRKKRRQGVNTLKGHTELGEGFFVKTEMYVFCVEQGVL